MINPPVVFNCCSFQRGWLTVSNYLKNHGWESYTVVVHITNPSSIDCDIHEQVKEFAKDNGLLRPISVSNTIFPQKIYHRSGNRVHLYNSYLSIYARIMRMRPQAWGTYFGRMLTYYDGKQGISTVNQIENIINAIRRQSGVFRSAFTIVIPRPGGETIRRRGGPCLHHITVQLSPDNKLGLLAIYRKHDFLERAYGNYWGLCNLLQFLAEETGFNSGPLTCISSHAYVDKKKTEFKQLINNIEI